MPVLPTWPGSIPQTAEWTFTSEQMKTANNANPSCYER